MPPKKNNRHNLRTDKDTDYLFEYFMNEDKFNEQLRGELDRDTKEKLANRQPKLDSRINTEKPVQNMVFCTESEEKELPTISEDSEKIRSDQSKKNEPKNRSERLSSIYRSPRSTRSPAGPARTLYGQRVDPPNSPPKPRSEYRPKSEANDQYRPPLQDDYNKPNLINDVDKYMETPEERRARARDAYSNLQDLVEKYDVTLTRRFTIDDDPTEMEEEYKMHKDRRNKHNQVKFYKNILLNIVCGAEFLNDKYNPFEFKLKDWSKQVASDMDDYTEVLEEIYEKYKNRGGKMAPEVRLLFMIVMSGVTFHLSQALFGSGGLGDTVKNNPNVLNKLLGGLMKGGGVGSMLGGSNNDAEPTEARQSAPNNQEILNRIRSNRNKGANPLNTTENNANRTETESRNDRRVQETEKALALERERRLLAEQKAMFETQMRKQNEMYTAQIDNLRNQINSTTAPKLVQTKFVNEANPINPTNPTNLASPTRSLTRPVNRVLNIQRPEPHITQTFANPNSDIFDKEMSEDPKSTNVPRRIYMDEVMDSLEKSLDLDFDNIIETSSRNNNRTRSTNNSTRRKSRPVSTTRKPRANTIHSVNSSAGSDILSVNKRGDNVLKI